MIKAIVTKAYPDGTFAEVGMNTRTVIGPYKRESDIRKQALNYSNGKKVRIEFYRGKRILGEPYKVEINHGYNNN